MFKFMKSKKGFSLVELMIVVVIMAILVAVAVPIFNSVTGSSRAKTCIDNQRSIISSLNTALLGKTISDEFKFTVVNTVTGTEKRGYCKEDGTSDLTGNGLFLTSTDLEDIFQTVPYCPVDDSVITVTISPTEEGTCAISTLCENNNGTKVEKDAHDLTA